MRTRYPFDYAVVRIVPRVDRGEFINAGIILYSSTAGFLSARVHCDRRRLHALARFIDLREIESHLATIPRICEGGPEAGLIGSLVQRERFRWLVSPRSTIIQPSPVHSGLHHDLKAVLDNLFEKLVIAPRE